MKNVKCSESGFTLLELTFAAGVLAVALSLLFGSLLSISVVGDIAEAKAVANTQIASILEEVCALTLEDLAEYAPPPLTAPGAKRAVLVEVVPPGATPIALPLAVGQELAQPLANPLPVRVTVIWENDSGHIFSENASTEVAW